MPLTVKKDSKIEFKERKSVFIGQAFFVTSEKDAKEKIEQVREEHLQASHVCFAYSLRSPSVQRFSDDGEPSSTAGMPILHVITAQGLVDTLVTVTRYFGGILLGAGGLVRAYSTAAADALTAAGKSEMTEYTSFDLTYGYDLHNSIERVLANAGAEIRSRSFGEQVFVTASLPTAEYEIVAGKLLSEYHKYIKIVAGQAVMGRKK